jgi:hypothetical protein
MAACKEVIMAVRTFAKHSEDVIKENLDASFSEDGLIQAARNHGNNSRSQMLGFKLGLEAKLALAVQWDGLLEMWRDPKSEASRELKDHSEGKNRFLKQGVSVASLGTQLLLDKTDKYWVNLSPTDQEKAKSQLRNPHNVGRLLAVLWRALGSGLFTLMNQKMLTA